MFRDNYICALDIGSSKISACVARIKKHRIVEVFFETAPSQGIKRGAILNSFDTVEAITGLLKKLRNLSGINIKFIYVNISGQDIITRHSRAILPLAERGNKVITQYDIKNVNEQARILGSRLEEEIIHQIPFSYAIDSKDNIANPLGLYSHKLEVDLYLVCGKLSSIQSLVRAVNQAGYDIKDIFFSGIATSVAVFNKEGNKGVTILCDIGSDITELLLFKDGSLRDISVLPIGGEDLTKGLCEELQIPFDLAEDVKISHAHAGDFHQIEENKEILIKKNNVYKPIKQKLICEIITAKTNELCIAIKDAVDKIITINEVDNFITTGRTALLEGFLETLENTLGVPVGLGRILNPDLTSLVNNDVLKGQKYLTYLTVLGMASQALKKERPQVLPNYQPPPNLFIRIFNRVKEAYQEYF